MAGNTFGRVFTVTSFGESHGPAIGCVVDGCPPGLALSAEDIQKDLDRRKPGTSRHVTQRQESDTVEILSGVFEGKTTGTPIALLIRNEDQRSRDYGNLVDTFRPGHADYTYWQKYGIRDHRGGGRSSARETAVRVAAAAIARKWLAEKYGVVIRGYLSQLGPIEVPFQSWDAVGSNPFFAADAAVVGKLESFMDELRKAGDSVGAKITTVAEHVPVGGSFFVEPRVRYYKQSKADFFAYYLPSGAAFPSYASSDSRLDGFRALSYGGTVGYRLVALNAKTGQPVGDFGTAGIVDLKTDFDQEILPDLTAGEVGLQSAPTVAGVPAKIVGEAGCAEPSKSMDQLIADHATGL